MTGKKNHLLTRVSLIALAILLTLSAPFTGIASAATTSTVEGAPPAEFGKNTSVDPVNVYGEYPDNIDRSKNSQLVPPPFGSSEFNYKANTSNFLTPDLATQSAPATIPPDIYYSGQSTSGYDMFGIEYPNTSSTTTTGGTSPTLPTKFTPVTGMVDANGKLGTLKIPAIGLTVTVFEGESLTNLAKGVGHFAATSAWEGNVAIAGHNRGSAAYFGQIHTLREGDLIEYTTILGTKQYKVVSVGQIAETDFSGTYASSDNRITLITCVRDIPELRWQVVALEVT